jgi:hypothetical protein
MMVIKGNILMFIKRGGTDSKIITVLDKEKLTDEQKESVEEAVKQSNNQTDASIEKKSGS